jgi:flagellar hook-basal body complex protein FliE
MGLFGALSSLLDENSENSFEKTVTRAIDRVEDTLSATLDKAEAGVAVASQAVDKLDAGAQKIVDKAEVVTAKASDAIAVVDEQSQKLAK